LPIYEKPAERRAFPRFRAKGEQRTWKANSNAELKKVGIVRDGCEPAMLGTTAI